MSYAAPPLRRPPARAPVAAAPGGPPPLVAPPAAFDPGQRYNAAGQPDVHGGSSANFRASVAANNAQAAAKQDVMSARATPAVPVTTAVAAGGTPYADQSATYRAPKMGMAKIGDEVRYYPQTADSAETLQARRDANVAGHAAADAARGGSLATSQATFDAQHPPLIDPKTLVAKSLAGKYDKEGDAAATRANNNTTTTNARADLLKQQRDRIAALTPDEKAKLQQQAQTLAAQGKLDELHGLLFGEQAKTEQETRPGKVAGIQTKNDATAGANRRADLRLPFQNYRDAAQGFKATADPITGKPVGGGPALPAGQAVTPAEDETAAGPPLMMPPKPPSPTPAPPVPAQSPSLATPPPVPVAPAPPPAPATPATPAGVPHRLKNGRTAYKQADGSWIDDAGQPITQ